MPIRCLICIGLTLFFSVYAWRNYFVSLCAAILLMAIMQHPDVVDTLKNIGGIPGLSLWNVIMFNVVIAWLLQRGRQGLVWDMPRSVLFTLATYVAMILWSGLRLLQRAPCNGMTVNSVIGEDLVDGVKWIIPMVILFDVCRDRRRVIIGLFVVACLYLLLALQVVKHVPLGAAASDDFDYTAYKMVQESVGYNRVTLSMMLGGASWAMLALLPLAQKSWHRWMILAGGASIALGQALTGGRSGYVGWIAVGLILGMIRWRKILIAIPIVIVIIGVFMPAVRDRALRGTVFSGGKVSAYEMTSGRNIAWPYVIRKIEEGPILGFGREAMMTTGIYQKILDDTNNGEYFPHPHNAYLQVLLDAGIVGFFCVIPFYLIVMRRALSLFRDRSDSLYAAAGGAASALLIALLFAGFGGETFYPREGSLGMWAAIGLMLRVYVDRSQGGYDLDEPMVEESESSDSELQTLPLLN